jgi:hypothetical protein
LVVNPDHKSTTGHRQKSFPTNFHTASLFPLPS